MQFNTIINRSRTASSEFKLNRRNQLFTVINPLVGHDDEPEPGSVAFDGKQTAASMRGSYEGPIKARIRSNDSSI